jgi:uroporphyrinogen decarboxylase
MDNSSIQSRFMDVVYGNRVSSPPIWMMRQAGRYLPEYRALRAKSASFLDFCYTPDMAIEATMQPIKRFDLDAAIIFSDILVLPHALGQDVRFLEGEGPKLEPLCDETRLNQLASELDLGRLSPVFEALKGVRAQLDPSKALIGFCGAPWTVASYMIAGKSTPDQAPARLLAYQNPVFFQKLIDRLVEASIVYLDAQFQAGADVVQIFESFGGALPSVLFERLSVDPITRIITGLRLKRPDAPIIVFAKGAGSRNLSFEGLANVIGIDWQTDPMEANSYLSESTSVQGNLDPLVLVAGGEPLDHAIQHVLHGFKNRPHIFNLGHGIVPQTPIAHVEKLVESVRAFRG